MADSGFPRLGVSTPEFGELLFDKIFAENYMKMKEIRPRLEYIPSVPLRSANGVFLNVSLNSVTKIFVITVKGLEPTTSCVRDQDAITAPARHP